MALASGTIAPDFRLPYAPRADPVRLSDLRGEKVVLLFFPLAFSSVCTEEMCTVGERYDRYREMEARVFGVCVDSPFVTERFAEECGGVFPILSDFNREVIHDYDVVNPDLFGLAETPHRAVYVIDPVGRIAWSWVGENPDVMPDFDAVEAAVAQAG